MRRFVTRDSTWKLEEPIAFRKLTLSVIEMAVVTGVLYRVYRAVVLTHGATTSWLYLGLTFAAGAIFLFGMVTLHLGNFPVRQWIWRAPVFALVEASAEMVMSLALISLGREPHGSGRAELHHWWGMAQNVFAMRVVMVTVFALVLGGMVQLIRYALLRREKRESMAVHIHERMEQRAGTAGQ